MRVGVLFSGGKDSFYALYKARKYEEVACLISIVSENKESYMFHTPGQNLLQVQAEAVGLPLVVVKTKGGKEDELQDLITAIKEAKKKHKIKGIVTGALASTYQASRIQKICNDLKLWCFNPLWQKDQVVLLHELIADKFVVGINGVAAEPLDESWLGRTIDSAAVEELVELQKDHGINPAGEGGEFETFVIHSPLHKKRLVFGEPKKVFERGAGTLEFSFVRTKAA
mgnify:CR=1 FL=1